MKTLFGTQFININLQPVLMKIYIRQKISRIEHPQTQY